MISIRKNYSYGNQWKVKDLTKKNPSYSYFIKNYLDDDNHYKYIFKRNSLITSFYIRTKNNYKNRF